MRHSIRFKITFLLTVMVAAIILLTWIINSTFLSKFYIYTKMQTLDKAYHEIVSIYRNSNSSGYLSADNTKKMEQMALKYNLDINVVNLKNIAIIYPAQDNFSLNDYSNIYARVQGYRYPGSNPSMQNIKLLKNHEDYFICSLYEYANYIDLVGFFHNPIENTIVPFEWQSEPSEDTDNNSDNGSSDKPDTNERDNQIPDTLILLRTNLESIKESAALANEFLAYIAIAVVILGSFIMFIISRRFTRPIHDLAGIAKKMTDLDFDAKYEVKSKDEIGELGNSINTLSDKLEATISELKQANNELLSDIQKKTEIDEMRKEFLSNVSHELKTPISLIQGYAEGLKENINEDEESRNFYCEVIMDEADKMNQMVKKLLSLNELEFGNTQVNFVRFDISGLIRTILESTEILFRQKEVNLIFDQQEPVYVWADEYLIEQVLTNYISNALNHVSGQRFIEIKLIPHDDIVRIAVFNTGENIPEEELEKIWVKFYKVDKARTREYGGSGIGLSIVKAIMNSHNRECGVINRPVGVEFWFELDAKS